MRNIDSQVDCNFEHYQDPSIPLLSTSSARVIMDFTQDEPPPPTLTQMKQPVSNHTVVGSARDVAAAGDVAAVGDDVAAAGDVATAGDVAAAGAPMGGDPIARSPKGGEKAIDLVQSQSTSKSVKTVSFTPDTSVTPPAREPPLKTKGHLPWEIHGPKSMEEVSDEELTNFCLGSNVIIQIHKHYWHKDDEDKYAAEVINYKLSKKGVKVELVTVKISDSNQVFKITTHASKTTNATGYSFRKILNDNFPKQRVSGITLPPQLMPQKLPSQLLGQSLAG
mmetsp:Transcript_37031/g.93008  ORF Transcript_37031/g.93008 Transcript_37031/m.93008 type:complete len:279 (+) Transcript_37031:347-1183(+)